MNSVERGELAQQVMLNPVVQEAFSEIENLIMEEWVQNNQSDSREELWYTLQGLRRFKVYFEAAISSGKYDLAQIREKQDGI